ncbi:MAG TPA: DUF11 domain-containing protein, partial [Pedococcus sp.]|nr:DUF11 domain-containing protein [Pedococcus sp.]
MSVQVSGVRPVDPPRRAERTLWWRVTTFLLLCALFLVRVVPPAAPAYALSSLAVPSPVAFACATPTVFNASGSPTRLFAQTHGGAGSTFAPVGGASGVQYNAVGFNPADGLIYAVTGPGGTLAPAHLVVVDGTGAVFDRGAITGIPAIDLARGLNAGSFDGVGSFWVAAGGSTGSGLLYRVDLATRAASPLGGQTAPVRALDFTFAAGFLWGAGSASTVVRVDLATGRIATFGVPSLPAGPFPAAWTYANGHLGFDSTSGSVIELAVSRPDAAVPSFALVASGTGLPSNTNDGTSCTPRPVDLAIDTTGPSRRTRGAPVTWTLTVQNRGAFASSGFTVNDVVPAGYTDVSSTTPGCSVTGHAVRCHGAALATGARAVITLKASAPSHDSCPTNTASVVGAEPDPIPSNNTSSLKTCVRPSAGLTLVQTASTSSGPHRDGLARVGDLVTFAFVVTNHDEDPVYAVSVLERLARTGPAPVRVTCPHGPLMPGQSMTCLSSRTVTQRDVEAASVTSTAVATALSTAGRTLLSNTSTVVVPALLSVGLSLVRHVTLLVDRD